VVRPLPTYISKLYGDEEGEENAELHQTYDLISGEEESSI
jgi:hypothetical protein